jgi:hypothetical protein
MQKRCIAIFGICVLGFANSKRGLDRNEKSLEGRSREAIRSLLVATVGLRHSSQLSLLLLQMDRT